MSKSKKLLSVVVCIIMTLGFTTVSLAATGTTAYEDKNAIPQRVVSEKSYVNEYGGIETEYVWEDVLVVDSGMQARKIAENEDDQIGTAKWQKHDLSEGTLKHRAAKISPIPGMGKWYGMSQTDYPAWHYTRVRIVKAITGKILEDSNQVQVDTGMATARTDTDSLYLLNWDFRLRSYWGTEN